MVLVMLKRQLLTKVITIGILNVQGCWKEDKQQFIYEDALKYNLQILGLTESHLVQEDILTMTVRHQIKQWRYEVYNGGIQGINQYKVPVFLSRNL